MMRSSSLRMEVKLHDGHISLIGFGSEWLNLDDIEMLIRDLHRARRRIIAERKRAQEGKQEGK